MSLKIKNNTGRAAKEADRHNSPLFPFFSRIILHPYFGAAFAGLYCIIMLFVGLMYHTVGDYNVETDFFWSYVPEAKSVLQGTFIIEGFRGPAYPVILAFAGTFLGNFFRAGIVLSVLSASLTLFFAHGLFRRLFRQDAAFIGVMLMAVNRTFIQYSYTACTDMFFNFLAIGSVFFLLKNEQRSWINITVSAAFAALAYLTRYNGVFFLLAAPIILLIVNPYQINFTGRIKTTGIYFLVFLGVISPWGFYCLAEKGSFFYNFNYLNIAYEMFAKGKMGWDQFWNVESRNYDSLFQVIFSDPARFAETIFTNLYSHFVSDMELLLLWPLGIISAIGIIVFWKERPTKIQAALLIIGASFFAVLLLVFYGERFSMFLLILYITLALKTLTWKKLDSVNFFKRIHIGTLASLILLVWTFSEAYSFNRTNINSGPQEIPLIADWYTKNYGRGNEQQLVVSRKPHIAYYLGMTMVPFPYVDNENELKEQIRTSGASFLFFSMMEAYMRPQFRSLLYPQNSPSWLVPVTYTVYPPAVLYKTNFNSKP